MGSFQQVMVSEPSVESTISILRGLKERYETHHGLKVMLHSFISCTIDPGVRISDTSLVAAAQLANRYLHVLSFWFILFPDILFQLHHPAIPA